MRVDALRADVELLELLLGERVERLELALTNGRPDERSSMRFSAIVNSAMSPSSVRSSGTKPTPASSTRRTLLPRSSTPSRVMDPVVRGWRPRIASVSSVWPLPCTPAIARISPARTVNETSLTT